MTKSLAIKKLIWFTKTQLGFNPIIFMRSLLGLKKYLCDLLHYKATYHGPLTLLPCLSDYQQEGGDTKSEYFWQDLLVAQLIFKNAPYSHVDIGSRLDGFVAHVASFRQIEVFDIRPVKSKIPGVVFRQADLMSRDNHLLEITDSLSCLHALEHFGLGRYGDPINPNGYISGIENMSEILRDNGILYLSVPVGRECVEFNAHRIFQASNIIKTAKTYNLQLIEFYTIDPNLGATRIDDIDYTTTSLDNHPYVLGLFVFRKQHPAITPAKTPPAI